MSYSINGIGVYADVTTDPDSGKVVCVDFALHAPSRAVLEAVALAKNLMVPSVLNEGIEDARGANFFDVTVVLTPAVLDADGEVITPALLDPGYNCNLRIGEPLVSKKDDSGWFLWELLLLEWTGIGVEGTVNDKVPGVAVSGVSLVDLSQVATPQSGIA